MCDRCLDRSLHLDEEEDIRTTTKSAFEPIGGLVVDPRVSGVSAREELSAFSSDMMLIDVISGTGSPAALKSLQERPETLDIPLFFNTPKVQSHEIGGLKTIGAVDAIVERFVSRTPPDHAPKARAGKHD